MSNLKYLTAEQLEKAEAQCLAYIELQRNRLKKINSILNGQETRLRWIRFYKSKAKLKEYNP